MMPWTLPPTRPPTADMLTKSPSRLPLAAGLVEPQKEAPDISVTTTAPAARAAPLCACSLAQIDAIVVEAGSNPSASVAQAQIGDTGLCTWASPLRLLSQGCNIGFGGREAPVPPRWLPQRS